MRLLQDHCQGDRMDDHRIPLTEDLELWLWNPVECIAQLISNPAFEKSMSYVPEHVYADCAGIIQRYDEMWTADWWWDIQVSLSMIESHCTHFSTRAKLIQAGWFAQ